MITVRRAAADDAEPVRALMEMAEKAGALPAVRFNETYREAIADTNLVSIVVTVDSEVAAFGTVRFLMPLHSLKPVAMIQEFIVDDRCRGRGVAARLVSTMMLLARDRGCVTLEAESPRASKWSHRFFEKQGFVFTHYKLAMNIGVMAEEDAPLQAKQD